ncbi:MAG: hypothetical protein U0636_04765 [Phycisphaerales bacterium]
MENDQTDLGQRPAGVPARVSPAAVLATLAAVVAAVVIGMTGPHLRDRAGGAQQDQPIGELAIMAELNEAQAAYDQAHGRSQEVTPDRTSALAAEVLGHPALVPDLTAHGYQLRDARVVPLSTDLRALALLYRPEHGAGALSVFMMPDHGRIVRFDGFGRALPLAPGEEWAGSGIERNGRPRTVYAATDGGTLWMVTAATPDDVIRVAPSLLPRDQATPREPLPPS